MKPTTEYLPHIFSYHKPKDDQPERYIAIRAAALEFAKTIDENCPCSEEKTLAFRQLQMAVMWANSSIALNE